MHKLVVVGNAVVKLVPIGHENGARRYASIKPVGMLCASSRGIREHSHGRSRAVDLCPEITLRLWSSTRLLQHLECRLVAVDEFRFEQRIAHQIDDRLHRLSYTHHTG